MPAKGLSGVPADVRLESLPDPGTRFTLGDVIGSGISGTVHEAVDTQSGNKKVAIKIQKVIPEYENDVKEEYKILKYLASHPNLPIFYGAFYTKGEVWFVMQLCEGGRIVDLIRGLHIQNRHLSEEQIAFILRETVNALCYLHENHIIHRDVRASNILLTASGEIKIIDFGLSRGLKNTLDKRSTCLGSPCWMAPELIVSGRTDSDGVSMYDNRVDVWALGITALELAEGYAPYEDMHPTRAIFQIVKNPPPNFRLPSKWSQLYADFVTECLIKIPEERPFIFEFQEHPFLELVKEKTNVGAELVALKQKASKVPDYMAKPEIHIRHSRLQKKLTDATEAMIVEDLATIEESNEDKVMHILHERYNRGLYYTYIGEILVFLNPDRPIEIYGNKYHAKYQWKSRSDNSPHIYATADCAYQDMLHHKEPQNIIFSGETLSGKTTNCNHLIDHLLYLGKISNKISDKITAAMRIIQALGNAASPQNNNSTRHVINTQITFTTTGKLSGAIFYLYLLEKWRVTGYKCSNQGNFHIFYYFFDWLKSKNGLSSFSLNDKKYTYLYRKLGTATPNNQGGAVNEEKENVEKYVEILRLLEVLEFEADQIEIVQKILAAVILLGEITFVDNAENGSDVSNPEVADAVANLLGLDEKKFAWALCNYCIIQKGNAIRKRQTAAHAHDSLTVLARGLYSRLVDFIVNIINLRLSVTRIVLGDKNFVNVLDVPGFEVFEQNNLEQLFNNSTNEQLQCFYNERIFKWELKEQEDEGILLKPMQFYDNKPTVDELMGKPDGLLYVIDEASRSNSGHSFIIDTLANSSRGTRIRKATSTNFTVAHFCKKVEYNATDIPLKNHDFLPPEMIETMRLSGNFVVKQLFTNQFTKAGSLTISTEQNIAIFSGKRKKWGAALVSGDSKSRKFNTDVQGEFSQTRRMRTCASVFRAASAEILKTLSDSVENTNISFVRCIRAGLPHVTGFEPDVVSPQLRSLAILDTIRARQIGYSYRVSFKDFIERYKFLAFDFDEPVDVSRENCRLLLIRLKMEGWIIGKNKVFLSYYDKEYLSRSWISSWVRKWGRRDKVPRVNFPSMVPTGEVDKVHLVEKDRRLYETQVKKIVKIQAVMRKFITKKKVIPRVRSQQSIEPTPARTKKIEESNEPTTTAPAVTGKIKSYEDDLTIVPALVCEWGSLETIVEMRNPSADDEGWMTLVSTYTQIQRSRQKFVIAGRYKDKKKSVDDLSDDDEFDERVSTKMKRCRGQDSIRTNSDYSVELPDIPNALFDGRDGNEGGIAFLATFMQFMCPSCCGGLFSEPKGSVYTKRKPMHTDTMRSETTTISLEEAEKTKPEVFSSFLGIQRQMAVDNQIEEEVSELNKYQPHEGVSDPGPGANLDCDGIAEILDVVEEEEEEEGNRSPQPQPGGNKRSKSKQRKHHVLERDKTVHEELHMYSKELTEKVNKEHGHKSENGEVKWSNILRKTSYPNNEAVPDDTVVELKIAGKDHVEVRKQNGNSEAPFDFQAFLRKTNTTRHSLRRFSDIAERFPDESFVIAELLPNVVLEGKVYNL